MIHRSVDHAEAKLAGLVVGNHADALDVSEAALYRHFPSKSKMFEGLIEFIEETLFSRINIILAEDAQVAGRMDLVEHGDARARDDAGPAVVPVQDVVETGAVPVPVHARLEHVEEDVVLGQHRVARAELHPRVDDPWGPKEERATCERSGRK